MSEFEPRPERGGPVKGGSGPVGTSQAESRGGGWRKHERLNAPEPGPSPGLATLGRSDPGVSGGEVEACVATENVLADPGPARAKADTRLLELERELNDRVDLEAQWLSTNWTTFTSATMSNPTFVYPKAQFERVVDVASHQPSIGGAIVSQLGSTARSVGVGAAAGAWGDHLMGKASSGIERAIARGVGKAFPVLFDLVWGIIEDHLAEQRVKELLHQRSVEQGERITEQLHFFGAQAASAKAQDRSVLDSIRASVDLMTTEEELAALDAWVDSRLAELPPARDPKDTSLHADMLAHWVLQHAGDLDVANDETDQVDFHAAKTAAKSGGAGGVLEEGKKSLYKHQLTYALARHGLSTDPVAMLPPGGVRGLKVLPGVKVDNPETFAVAMRRHDGHVDAGAVQDHRAAAKRGDVRIDCRFECDFEEGMPLLDRVEFKATCVGRSREAWDRRVTFTDGVGGGFAEVEWEYEPT